MNENENISATETDWDNWDNLDFSTEEDEASASEEDEAADQLTEDETEDTDTSDTEEGVEENSDQNFVLKHLDETRTVSRDEVITLAQKGMDYDRIRQKLDDLTANQEAIIAENKSEAELFLKELADRQRITVEQLIDNVRAEAIAKDEGIDISIALGRVQNAKERAAIEKERNAMNSGNADDEARHRAINAFVEAYPSVKAQDIPKSVWDEYAQTGDLVNAYRNEENRQLKQQIADLNQKLTAQKQNNKNKGRSTGSQNSDGVSKNDPILADWYGSK